MAYSLCEPNEGAFNFPGTSRHLELINMLAMENETDRLKVLIIENDPSQLGVLRIFLDRQGYDVYPCSSGEEGTTLALRIRPDIVLMDVCLPDIDGYTACQKIKRAIDVPVIFFSAKTDEADVVEGFRSGADDFISKPIHLHELASRMETRLRNSSHSPQINLYCDKSLLIDLKHRKVMRKGVPVHLTPLEYKLLACLVRHAGEVVSHKTLLKEVWGHCYMDGVTNLSLYIHYLREKLEDDPENPLYIRSEWGSGYWFSAQNEEEK